MGADKDGSDLTLSEIATAFRAAVNDLTRKGPGVPQNLYKAQWAANLHRLWQETEKEPINFTDFQSKVKELFGMDLDRHSLEQIFVTLDTTMERTIQLLKIHGTSNKPDLGSKHLDRVAEWQG